MREDIDQKANYDSDPGHNFEAILLDEVVVVRGANPCGNIDGVVALVFVEYYFH